MRKGTYCGFLVVVIFLCCGVAFSANNPYGIMTRHSGGHDSIWCSYHLQLARDLCGEWGYTRTGGKPSDIWGTERNLIMHRAKHLIPILGVSSHLSPSEVAAFIQTLKDDGYKVPYLEIGNEPQGEWDAADYATHLLQVCQAVKAVDPDIKIMNGGFAGNGADYLDEMFTAVPDLVNWLDIVCCHPYSINYPPDHPDGFLSYLDTVAVMDAHGFTGPIAFTEFGYELGNQANPAYPKITEELRAQYMVEIFKNYIEKDPRILAACPFILGDQLWNGWADWDWVRFDRTVTPQYEAVAALPKPQGEDYLPSGPGTVSGRVVDPGLNIGVEGVFVYLLPGPYAAETGEDGTYTISNIPEGTYRACAFKDGYKTPEMVTIDVSSNVSLNFSMPRLGIVYDDFDWEGYAGVAGGWTTADGEPHPDIFSIDQTVKHSGRASQRMIAGGPMIWKASNYNSIFTGEVWHAEVWVKTEGLVGAPEAGVYLRIDFRDNYYSYVGTTFIYTGINGDLDWTPLAMTFVIPENARRMQVILGCDADAGTVWFDDLFIDRATLPLPSWDTSPEGWLAGGWNMISFPMRPKDPFAEKALDDCLWGGTQISGNLYQYNPASSYESFPDQFMDVQLGRGYWMYLNQPAREVLAGYRQIGQARIPLEEGWNLIGYPFTKPQEWSRCQVSDGEHLLSIEEASEANWLQPVAIYYSNGYHFVGTSPIADDTYLRPWYAYWILALEPGLELIIPDPVGVGAFEGYVEDEYGVPVAGAVISAQPGCFWDISDENGHYQILDVPGGTYDLRVTAKEYITQTVADKTILPGETTQVNFTLQYLPYPTEVQNPGFEEGIGTGIIPGWTRFGEVDGIQTGPWYGGITAHSGIGFLGTAANWGAKDGGVYQKVMLDPGLSYKASVWYCVYWSGGTPGERGCRLGVDPTGGDDPESSSVLWTSWASEPNPYIWHWRKIELDGIAVSPIRPVATIFLQHFQRPGGVWNITCFDDVELSQEE